MSYRNAAGSRVQIRHLLGAVEARAEALGSAQAAGGELDGINLRRAAGENGTRALDAVRRYDVGAVEERRRQPDALPMRGFSLERPRSMCVAGEIESVA